MQSCRTQLAYRQQQRSSEHEAGGRRQRAHRGVNGHEGYRKGSARLAAMLLQPLQGWPLCPTLLLHACNSEKPFAELPPAAALLLLNCKA